MPSVNGPIWPRVTKITKSPISPAMHQPATRLNRRMPSFLISIASHQIIYARVGSRADAGTVARYASRSGRSRFLPNRQTKGDLLLTDEAASRNGVPSTGTLGVHLEAEWD